MDKDKSGTRYCIEADIYHFYDSLVPEIVMRRIKTLIKDHKILDLIERILSQGVQIGAYCSQWLANTFLQPLDHAIREQFKASHYIRYMDNFTIFCSRKRESRRILAFISEWLKDMGLSLKATGRYSEPVKDSLTRLATDLAQVMYCFVNIRFYP